MKLFRLSHHITITVNEEKGLSREVVEEGFEPLVEEGEERLHSRKGETASEPLSYNLPHIPWYPKLIATLLQLPQGGTT